MGQDEKTRSTERIEAGRARARVAMEHLLAARTHLDAACADLCSVIGGNDFWRTISRLSKSVSGEMRHLDHAIESNTDPLTLTRDPTPEEVADPHASGCGFPKGDVSRTP